MKTTGLIARGFRYYAKSHIGLLLGAFLASAILSGSLIVGDSVRGSLERAAAERLGKVQSGVLGGDRWFTDELARKAGAVPAIVIRGAVSAAGGKARANAVQVLGVDAEFWKLSLSGREVLPGTAPAGDTLPVAVNDALARKLGVKAGDSVLVRVEKPSAISRDAPLSGEATQDLTVSGTVAAVISGEDFGNFQLQAAQTAPENIFVPLAALQESLGQKGRVNAMLGRTALPESALAAAATVEDFSLKIGRLGTAGWQVTTDRVFLDDVIADKLLASLPDSTGTLTYLINDFGSAKGHAPYAFATAARFGLNEETASEPSIYVNQWLADDLQVAVGDKVSLRYFTVGLGRELKEQTAEFKVREILPMNDPRVNPSWTPDFPGVSEAKNCRDWKPGIPMKLDAIREKDEAYWKQYHATPKAFISLAEGQKLWSNRFGKLTGIRFEQAEKDESAIRAQVMSKLQLTDIGLVPRDFHAEAVAAAKGSVDFGGLFVGLSLFLIAAALVFSALLFVFTLEKRAPQIGLLLSIGWREKQVRNLIMGEAGLVAVLGAVLGLGGGLLYTKLALLGLNSAWSGATVGLKLTFDARPLTLIIAFVSSLIASLGTLWWVSRKIFRASAKDLLAGEVWTSSRPVKQPGWLSGKVRAVAAPLFLVLAVVLPFLGAKATDPEEIAGMFFSSGFCLLTGGLMLLSRWFRRLEKGAGAEMSLGQIGLRNVTRRRGRSLAVAGMMAGGIFLVIAVNAFRLGAESDPTRRDSGTGGFALVGESTLPIYEDLNSEAAWDAFALDDKLMAKAKFAQLRLREGDDASCLNLNKAQRPVLCAVNPKPLAERRAFAFAKGSWDLLSEKSDEIPAIADQATAQWGLGKGIGDTIEYTDSQGRAFKVKLVGLLAGSILQGKVIISEKDFLAKYPDAGGYKFFLVDAPVDAAPQVSAQLSLQLQTRGLALETAGARLATFQQVQNTYIGIFTVLGGLGVLLGTAGLGVLAARNILERRGEFALMQAVGFRQGALRRMVLSEHVALLIVGLLLGLVSAAIAVLPDVRQSGGSLPFGFIAALVCGILGFGVVVCWIASVAALRGHLLSALRRE